MTSTAVDLQRTQIKAIDFPCAEISIFPRRDQAERFLTLLDEDQDTLNFERLTTIKNAKENARNSLDNSLARCKNIFLNWRA
jgi:hypothetical protein